MEIALCVDFSGRQFENIQKTLGSVHVLWLNIFTSRNYTKEINMDAFKDLSANVQEGLFLIAEIRIHINV